MGIDYRVVNGYVYISANPVTDPDEIAERAEFFQKRAGHYFANWDELYVKWREKMEALNREVEAIEVPRLARVRARRGGLRRPIASSATWSCSTPTATRSTARS